MDAAACNFPMRQSETEKRHLRLQQAALKGDWATAKGIFDGHPTDIIAMISMEEETVLHTAVGAERTDFVRKLMNLMTEVNLPLDQKDRDGNTALCLAAISGNVELAKLMVEKNELLTSAPGKRCMLPIQMAALQGHKDMVRYLYKFTVYDLEAADFTGLLSCMINIDLYDLAFHFLDTHKYLVRTTNAIIGKALLALARKHPLFSKSQPKFWIDPIMMSLGFKRCPLHKAAQELSGQLVELLMHSAYDEIPKVLRPPLFAAAAFGNVELLRILIRSYPDLIWECDDSSRFLFHTAAYNRHEGIFNLIHELGPNKHLISAARDGNDMTLLDIAASLPPISVLQTVSGAALQMQRELLWFQAVEKMGPYSHNNEQDSKPKVPRAVFTETHESLRKEGQEWMKNTASSCMLVATLVATVVFAAGFTVPGGSNSETGTPILQTNTLFTIFVLSDTVALFSSLSSVLIFLSILTSRYAERDFRLSLPLKLMFGLLTLFLSIVTMVVAFRATVLLIYNKTLGWIPIFVTSLASVTVICFSLSLIRLLVDTISSMFSSVLLFRASRNRLFG